MIVHFCVQGNPKPKERPRFGKHAVYTTKKTSDWEKLIKKEANAFMISHNMQMLSEIDLAIILLFRRETRQRVDIDNLTKSVLDGMNKIVYEDDRMIKTTIQSMSIDKENPGVDIWVFNREDFIKMLNLEDLIANICDKIEGDRNEG